MRVQMSVSVRPEISCICSHLGSIFGIDLERCEKSRDKRQSLKKSGCLKMVFVLGVSLFNRSSDLFRPVQVLRLVPILSCASDGCVVFVHLGVRERYSHPPCEAWPNDRVRKTSTQWFDLAINSLIIHILAMLPTRVRVSLLTNIRSSWIVFIRSYRAHSYLKRVDQGKGK